MVSSYTHHSGVRAKRLTLLCILISWLLFSSENLLLDDTNSAEPKLMISDFGLSALYTSHPSKDDGDNDLAMMSTRVDLLHSKSRKLQKEILNVSCFVYLVLIPTDH
jgi:hypothetical protein